MDTPTSYRYEQLAELIVGMIDKGALAPGMRLPSVRAVSEQHRISISTALQAYRLLEDRGVLVARPQSGFYVAAARRGALALPSASRPRAKASTVSISGAVAGLLEHASNSALVPLGCAVPDAALLQAQRLDLALARAARQHGTRYNTYCAPHGEPRLRDARRACALARRRARDVRLHRGADARAYGCRQARRYDRDRIAHLLRVPSHH
jgi:DNA-binding transcriptional MocR family regulator